MPSAWAILATWLPSRPSPIRPEGLAFDIDAERALPGPPVLEALAFVADPPRELEHQADGDADGRIAGGLGAAGHDPALPGGLQVQHPVAFPGRDQELEIGQRLDQAARKRGALAHQHHHVEALERPGDLVRPAERGIEDRELDLAGELDQSAILRATF